MALRVLLDNASTSSRVGGRFSTCRLGRKWADSAGEDVVLAHSPEGADGPLYYYGQAVVTEVWTGKFEDLPDHLIALNAVEAARTYTGLREAMEAAYGDKFEPASDITMLVYLRTA